MINATQVHGTPSQKEAEYLTGWQRARADLANLQNRLQDERVGQQKQTKREVTYALLSLSDNFQAMTSHVPDDIADNNWVEGVLHVARQLDSLLEQFNVTAISAEGASFDPVLHEAIEEKEVDGVKSGIVYEVIQTGYQLEDEVIRPAKVKVAK